MYSILSHVHLYTYTCVLLCAIPHSYVGVYQPEPGRPSEVPDSGGNEEEEKSFDTLLAGLVFVPPLVLDLCSQDNVFEAALDFGGTYGDLTLFGITLALDMLFLKRNFCGFVFVAQTRLFHFKSNQNVCYAVSFN